MSKIQTQEEEVTTRKNVKEIVLYLFFGVATTLVNWCIYVILHSHLKLDMTVTNAIAWFGAVIFAYLTNRKYVFESKVKGFKGKIKEIGLFFAARAASGVFEVFLPTGLFMLGLNQSLFGVDGFIAKAATSVIVIVLNYIFCKWIVFKKN